MGNAKIEAEVTFGDWAVAVLSLLLSPLVPLLLSIYNFTRGRRKLGALYLSVCVFGILVVAVLTLAKI